MPQSVSQKRLSVGARMAISGLCWMGMVCPHAAAVPPGETVSSHGFRLAAAECVDGRGAEDGFDLGLEAIVGSGWTKPAGQPSPPQNFAKIVRPSGMPDWTAQLVPAENAAAAPVSPTERSDRIPEKPYGWKQFRYDLRFVAHKPAHLDAKEKRTGFAIIGTTGLLYVYRKDIQEAWQESKSERRSDFLSKARFMGGGAFAPAVALTAYLASFATHNDREKETAQLVLESFALSGLGAGIGQFVLATERPEDGDAIRYFRPDGHGVSFDVAIAASVIPPLRRQYLRVSPGDTLGRKILKHGLSALLYSGMVFTALQRIDANKHWAPDVFLGMVTGLGVGRTLGQAHDQAEGQRRSRLRISALRGGVAVTLTMSIGPR